MKYFEIILRANRRPDYPEDNTIIIKADSMLDAISKLNYNSGNFTIFGDVITCREIYYVYDNLNSKPCN